MKSLPSPPPGAWLVPQTSRRTFGTFGPAALRAAAPSVVLFDFPAFSGITEERPIMNHATTDVSDRIVPPGVQRYVSRALASLQEDHRVLTEVANAHGRYYGYHLCLKVRDLLPGIDNARARLAAFREEAIKHGVNASAVVSDLGGEPDFSGFKVPPYSPQDAVAVF